MEKISLAVFAAGVRDELVKRSQFSLDSMPSNENILPNIAKQAKWRYVRTKDGLKLTDGNLVYSFGLPENYPAEDTPVERLSDDNILDFERDALSKGTAQVHRASPDSIYMTLADGSQNPTFMLAHEEGKRWRYSPAKKFLEKLRAAAQAANSTNQKVLQESAESEQPRQDAPLPPVNDATLIDPESLMQGGIDTIKKAVFDAAGFLDGERLAGLITGTVDAGKNLLAWKAAEPVLSAGAGFLGAHAIGKIRDRINPARIPQRKMNPGIMRNSDLVPIAAGFIPTLAAGAIMH